MPKQAQGYVVAGLAVLILMAVMFSKNHAKPAAERHRLRSPLAVSTDMNQRKIQELEQDLSADQRQSQQQAARTENRWCQRRQGHVCHCAQSRAARRRRFPLRSCRLPSQPAEPPRDPVADAEKALAFKARFASNLVSADDGRSRGSSTDSADASGRMLAARSASSPQAPLAGFRLRHGRSTSVRRR